MLTHLTVDNMMESEREVTAMDNLSYVLDNMVPITLFNRGQAGKIFSRIG